MQHKLVNICVFKNSADVKLYRRNIEFQYQTNFIFIFQIRVIYLIKLKHFFNITIKTAIILTFTFYFNY